VRRGLGVRDKLEALAQSAQFDLCGTCGGEGRTRADTARWIYPAALPDGTRVRLLKTLMTNVCRNDCRYCGMRCSRDFRRTSYQAEELARLFVDLWQARQVQGLFLSSSVPGDPDRTMQSMVAAAEILRRRHHFQGYIHLKVLPGASRAAVEAAAAVADRISVNLEAPSAPRLRALAPDKDWAGDLRERVGWLGEMVASGRFRARSHTTQFVVGAAGESDSEIIRCVAACYADERLSRAYYSAYQPPDRDALPGPRGDVLTREHRLYQADWLLRKYGFSVEEIPLDTQGNLDLGRDPKQAWAERHPELFPVEVNEADYAMLLRVPGIGPTSAARIVRARRQAALTRTEDLRRMGVAMKRASRFVLVAGRGVPSSRQLTLWA